MSTPDQDLRVGRCIAVDMLDTINSASAKLGTRESRIRMWLGIFAALGGAAWKDIGAADAVFTLRAAIDTLGKMKGSS